MSGSKAPSSMMGDPLSTCSALKPRPLNSVDGPTVCVAWQATLSPQRQSAPANSPVHVRPPAQGRVEDTTTQPSASMVQVKSVPFLQTRPTPGQSVLGGCWQPQCD